MKDTKFDFPLAKENYKYMLIGFGIIMLGFLLMIGGGSDDPTKFSEDIFSFRRITLAPIVVLIGFASIFWAIMKKTKEDKE